MKSRQVTFYVEHDQIPQLVSAVQDYVVPRYEEFPHFLGLTMITAETGTRAEVIVTCFWEGGLEGSESESTRFIEEMVRVTGCNPSRKAYDTLYAQVRDAVGTFRLDPTTTDQRTR